MITRRPRFLALCALAGVLTLASARLASAQTSLTITDPYDPWNLGYRSFIYPTAPINPAMPGQGRYNKLPGPAPYQNFSGFPSDDPFERNQPSNRFVPYYRNYQVDSTLDRKYVPNRNDTFYVDQQERQKRYFEALREKDPGKRAEMLKKLEEETRQAARSAGSARQRSGAAKTAAPRDGGGGTASGATSSASRTVPNQLGVGVPPSTEAPFRPDRYPPKPMTAPEETPEPEPQPADVLERARQLLGPSSSPLDRQGSLRDRPGSVSDRPSMVDSLLRRPGTRRPGLNLAPLPLTDLPLPGTDASRSVEDEPALTPPQP